MSYFLSTPAAAGHCPRCKSPILIALDEGVPARVDTRPIPDSNAELAALLENRATYRLARNRHLIQRQPIHIAAGTPAETVHAEHKCSGPQQMLITDMVGEQ